jgi:hypothetical protein
LVEVESAAVIPDGDMQGITTARDRYHGALRRGMLGYIPKRLLERHRPNQGKPNGTAERRLIASPMLTTEAMVCEISEKQYVSSNGGERQCQMLSQGRLLERHRLR